MSLYIVTLKFKDIDDEKEANRWIVKSRDDADFLMKYLKENSNDETAIISLEEWQRPNEGEKE